MPLFDFRLADVPDIVPWGDAREPHSWLALTDGWFWVDVGAVHLGRFRPSFASILDPMPYVDYQVAHYLVDTLPQARAALVPVPPELEPLASDWRALRSFRRRSVARIGSSERRADEELHAAAWTWLGLRTVQWPYTIWRPTISFVRVGDRMRVGWDNRDPGARRYAGRLGSIEMPVDRFEAEMHGVVERLFAAMAGRIDDLEAGRVVGQAPADPASLRAQHEQWRGWISWHLGPPEPEQVPWERTIRALRSVARRVGVEVPGLTGPPPAEGRVAGARAPATVVTR